MKIFVPEAKYALVVEIDGNQYVFDQFTAAAYNRWRSIFIRRAELVETWAEFLALDQSLASPTLEVKINMWPGSKLTVENLAHPAVGVLAIELARGLGFRTPEEERARLDLIQALGLDVREKK